MVCVRNAWYVAAWANELKSEKPFAIRILDEPLVIWRNAQGELTALEDRCVHRLAPLSLGRCEGDKLRCMYHGLLFDRDGKVVEIPGQDLVPAKARVANYPVVEKHSWIWVWMGDAERADPALIPPAVGLDDPDYLLGHGQMDYAAEARLINDNLLDFSHLSYVHANSFQASESWARERPKITTFDRGLRFERWLRNQTNMPGKIYDAPVDRYARYDFVIPGILLMTGGIFPAGTADALKNEAPDLSQAEDGVTFTSQAVTPMTEKTSRYFYSWGPHRDFGTEQTRDGMMEIATMAFGEDRTMIEAQQRAIDATPQVNVMPTSADRGLTLFHRMLEKLAREDAAQCRKAS